ncbi:MAG: tRNA (adenosine(37)-N6)-threonylcarbamoyltransferase complex dimerization subunit type 1 TsaB [Chlorobium sp.]|uniref:tRNA (adenosine(37)-N6)-threonylcarbamoyltransferase complex dimerization subunit type 1 TsaB n=1 Tax=Chlorobium sp. TaxID=1095 RepID=UPI0025C2F1B4|nr:tRNA (adenosine(37)-N6)-threonylcarbamoyltransferase complex dimerization subunit type 1 TsaB [Chlorobium sp.]MCF8382315.1 tRNA (adenosine(37)-N6)-threonylcarbamoyltransferase complex dimerization subunit type 1 TsaB [Chlorobium sp.]
MNILAIECTHVSLSAAVMSGGEVTLLSGGEWNRAAESILPLVQQALENSHTARGQLDAVAISSGPGSFTALRIGMSAAKGLAYGLGIPLVPVPTLPAMAVAALHFTFAEVIVPVVPSRRGEYYYCCYRRTRLEEGFTEDEIARGSMDEVLRAAGATNCEAVVTARRTDNFPVPEEGAAAGFLDAAFFSAASLFPEASRLFGLGSALSPAEAFLDYRQMFVPGGRKE